MRFLYCHPFLIRKQLGDLPAASQPPSAPSQNFLSDSQYWAALSQLPNPYLTNPTSTPLPPASTSYQQAQNNTHPLRISQPPAGSPYGYNTPPGSAGPSIQSPGAQSGTMMPQHMHNNPPPNVGQVASFFVHADAFPDISTSSVCSQRRSQHSSLWCSPTSCTTSTCYQSFSAASHAPATCEPNDLNLKD